MKLIHFALALTFVLIGFTGWLAFEAHQEARGAKREVQLLRQQQNAQVEAGAVPMPSVLDTPLQASPAPSPAPAPAPAPAPTTFSSAPPPPPMEATLPTAPSLPAPGQSSLPPRKSDPITTIAVDPPPAATPEFTAQQRQILALPAIATVRAVVLDQGFVIINTGSDQGITSGMTFNLRRGSAIVGQVRIGSIIEATESVADIIAGSLPVGVTPKEGDELIQITGS